METADPATAIGTAIGDRVRDRRVERGCTLDQPAERSEVNRRMVIDVEHGASTPSIATLLRLSDALGVGLPALVDLERPGALRVLAAGQAPVLWRGPGGPVTDEALLDAADDLVQHLRRLGADVQVTRRLLSVTAQDGA